MFKEKAQQLKQVDVFTQLFESILLFCEPTNISLLWSLFKDNLCEDILYNIKKNNTFLKFNNTGNLKDIIENEAFSDEMLKFSSEDILMTPEILD